MPQLSDLQSGQAQRARDGGGDGDPGRRELDQQPGPVAIEVATGHRPVGRVALPAQPNQQPDQRRAAVVPTGHVITALAG